MAASGIEIDQRELQRCSSPTIMSPLCVLHSLVRLNTDENADAEFPFWFGIRVLNGSRGELYGFFGMAPGSNKSDRSSASAASPRNRPTWNISCMVASLRSVVIQRTRIWQSADILMREAK